MSDFVLVPRPSEPGITDYALASLLARYRGAGSCASVEATGMTNARPSRPRACAYWISIRGDAPKPCSPGASTTTARAVASASVVLAAKSSPYATLSSSRNTKSPAAESSGASVRATTLSVCAWLINTS